MKERFPFREQFEPVVNVGENVELLPLSKNQYVKVDYIEPLPRLEIQLPALVAGVETADTEITQLYMENGEFAQFRILPVDPDVFITFFAQPRAQRHWATKNSVWQSIADFADPRMNPAVEKYNLNEFFQLEDEGLWMRFLSILGSPTPRIEVYGFRYCFSTLKDKPALITPIPVWAYHGKVVSSPRA